MIIKTWQEREFEAHDYVSVSPASNMIYMRAEITELRAELRKIRAQPVPEGMQLVPIEPTEAMLNAPPNAWSADALITYKAMLEAAKE